MSNAVQVGGHRVRCGNLTEGLGDLMGGEKCDIFYTDPPWGQGKLKYFHTMQSALDGVQDSPLSLPDFLDCLFGLAVANCKGIIIIEYGEKWEQNIRDAGDRAGVQFCGMAYPTYRGGKGLLPMHLHVYTMDPDVQPDPDYYGRVTDSHDYEMTRRAIAPFVVPGGIILDVCCGFGNTAKMALKSGMRFYGQELTQARLDRAVKLLGRHA